MPFALAVGTQLNNRYVVKKVLSFSAEGGIYYVRDVKITEKSFVVKELIPPTAIENELAERKIGYADVIHSIVQFDHPNLASVIETFTESRREYVVMENVEGLPLETVLHMSLGALSDKQVLNWGMQLCDALDYLHNRPRPFVFDVLSPTHVMVTASEEIKLINYGLDRFFEPGPVRSFFAEGPMDHNRDYVGFGELMYYFLTREREVDPNAPAPAGANPELFKIIKRCLGQSNNAVYKDFKDVKTQLEGILNPPAALERRSAAALTRFSGGKINAEALGIPTFDLGERLIALFNRFMSQKLLYLYLEVAGVILVLMVLWLRLNPGVNYGKQPGVPMAYVITGNSELWAISPGVDHQVLDRKNLKNSVITDMKYAMDGERLLLADARNNRIIVLDTANNEEVMEMQVDSDPHDLAVSPDRRTMYCLHPKTKNVSQISMETLKMSNIFAVPGTPTGLAVADDNASFFVSFQRQNQVQNMDSDTGKVNATFQVDGGPTALAVTPGGKEVWIACPAFNSIVVFDTSEPAGDQSPPRKATIELKDGRNPVAMRLSPNGLSMFVLCEDSDDIKVIAIAEHAITHTIPVGRKPNSWSMSPPPSMLWVANRDETSVTIVDPVTNHPTDQVDIGRVPVLVEMAP